MAHAPATQWRCLGLNMWQQVVAAFALGIAAGYALGPDAAELKVFGELFIKFIKMIVSPLIFFALISGITSLTSGHHLRGIVTRGVSAYLLTSVFAVSIGLFAGAWFEPGVGLSPPTNAEPIINTAPPSLHEFLMSIVPSNIVKAMAGDHYLQIVIFAVFTGIVINHLGNTVDRVKELNKELAHVTFKMIEWIVRLAPLAVFGFMAAMVGTTGVDAMYGLARLFGVVVGACLLQMVIFCVMIVVFARLRPLPFYIKMMPTMVMAFSTSSSKATLTTAMRELQDKVGVSRSSSEFMMPLGACINMDGTAIYLGICATFFAQMYGIELHLHDYLTLMLTCTLGSIGAAGIPSGSIIFMSMVLASVGIPLEGIGLILAVDRLLDMLRTTVNITGDAAITLIVDAREGTLDRDAYYDR